MPREDNYEMLEELGSGSFGVVSRARDIRTFGPKNELPKMDPHAKFNQWNSVCRILPTTTVHFRKLPRKLSLVSVLCSRFFGDLRPGPAGHRQ